MNFGFLFIKSMKKIILSLVIACQTVVSATAQITGNGYYRIQNHTTQRYMSLSDNTSRGINYQSTTVDASALLTKKNWDDICTDPGTIFYIEKINEEEYNIKSQGSDLYNMIKYYIRLKYYPGNNLYRAWQQNQATTVYLSDEYDITKNRTIGYVDNNNTSTMNWYIKAVNTEDNFLGIKPTVTANSKHYATFYASFPFSTVSEGMKVYYISGIKESTGMVIYKPLTGIIPAETPVIIECASTEPAKNKIKIEGTNPSKISDNQMTGVYFCLGNRTTAHYNSTEFKPESMRVLGVDEKGNLVFNNADTYMTNTIIKTGKWPTEKYPEIKAIPNNTGYLKVSATCPNTLKIVNEATGIKNVTEDTYKSAAIYTITGIKVCDKATSTEGLPKGIYLFKGKKIVVK